MSKIIYACFRNSNVCEDKRRKVEEICKELNPANISPRPPVIYGDKNTVYALTNPAHNFLYNKANVVLGSLFEAAEDWDKISTPAPDGNYVIFRSNNQKLEVLSDYLGTRNLWYYFDEDMFLAASSQKALILFLEDFQFDEKIIPWMLFNGTPGPTHNWDKRLKRLPPNSKITLDKKSWKIEIQSEQVIFSTSTKSPKILKKELEDALKQTFRAIEIDRKKWAITLSGGHDSRAILVLLKKYSHNTQESLSTITWGEGKSLLDFESDAHIAGLLAEKENTEHNYFCTEDTEKSAEEIINLFLSNGEGGIDHITGYLDGFGIWKKLFNNNFDGVIRGDEVFGYNKIFSPIIVRSFMGLLFYKDYENLKKYEYLNTLEQQLPANLEQKPKESLPTWRDRIFQQYRIPYIQASLADLKYPYVEQLNPFLSKRIVTVIRKLPDNLRTEKKLFKDIMRSKNPDIPFSKRDSNTLLKDAMHQKKFVDLIKKELSSEYAKNLFPTTFLDQLLSNLKVTTANGNDKPGIFNKFKKIIPKKVKTFIAQQNPKLRLDENLLAFRVFIICRMYQDFSKKINRD